jgi:two-component system LytT family response regulator
MRLLLVDDEAPARALLRELLQAHPEVEVVGECANGFEAVKAVGELAPDLMLLDVRMPKLDGFEVLELLGAQAPATIFTTAYDQHAVRAFEVNAVDYLLKPFDGARLSEALAKAGERLAATSEPSADALAETAAQLAQAAGAAGSRADRVLIRDGSTVHVLPSEEIDYVEAAGDQLRFHSRGQIYTKSQTLAQAEARLNPARFVRIHRSYLLNLDALSEIELYAKDSRAAILTNGVRLPVSRPGYGRLRELL